MRTILLLLCSALFGNYNGDQATLKDCATHGEAAMFGGGVIKCEVKHAT